MTKGSRMSNEPDWRASLRMSKSLYKASDSKGLEESGWRVRLQRRCCRPLTIAVELQKAKSTKVVGSNISAAETRVWTCRCSVVPL